MTRTPTAAEIAAMRAVLVLPGMEEVSVRRDIPYKTVEGETLTFDLYEPSGGVRKPWPLVLFVMGFPDWGLQKILGCKAKEMGSYVSWAQLVAVSGMAAVNVSTRQPAEDAPDAIRHLREHAGELSLDAGRIAIWSCSGNVPNALGVLTSPEASRLRCAALLYGYMMDLEGSTHVAQMAGAMKFANPAAGKSLADLPPRLPIFVARAGADQTPNLNETIDRFVAGALKANLPITVVNYPTGPHAFDLMEDSEASRAIVRQILGFLRSHLTGSP
jgi:hypothetical protein